MTLDQLKSKVLQRVEIETVLLEHFSYQKNGGRCPICGETHCIRAIEYDPGVNGYECITRGVEGSVLHLFMQGKRYPATYDPAGDKVADLTRRPTDQQRDNAVRKMAAMYLGIGDGSGQLPSVDPDSDDQYELQQQATDMD